MARGLFLTLGVFALILGLQCMVVDQAVLRSPGPPQAAGSPYAAQKPANAQVIQPPEWAPWSLMAGGAVTILYAIALPKRIMFA